MNKPCKGLEEKYRWGVQVIHVENETVKAVAIPNNSVCNSCQYFRKCYEDVISGAIKQGNQAMEELALMKEETVLQ